LHRSQYVYINFQVIISITLFFIDNSLGPLARDSPCTLNEKSSLCLVQRINSNELLFSNVILEHDDTFIPTLHRLFVQLSV